MITIKLKYLKKLYHINSITLLAIILGLIVMQTPAFALYLAGDSYTGDNASEYYVEMHVVTATVQVTTMPFMTGMCDIHYTHCMTTHIVNKTVGNVKIIPILIMLSKDD